VILYSHDWTLCFRSWRGSEIIALPRVRMTSFQGERGFSSFLWRKGRAGAETIDTKFDFRQRNPETLRPYKPASA
jgi:hypothetical protein